MGILGNLKKFVRGEDYDSEEYEEFNDSEESDDATMRWTSAANENKHREAAPAAASSSYERPASSSYSTAGSNVTDIRSNRIVNINTITQLSVVLVKPEKYDSASEIADHLCDKRTVVLNLESTNREVARRLLDFLGGVAYASKGKIQRIAQSTFIITPFNVELQGTDVLDELENNGLHL